MTDNGGYLDFAEIASLIWNSNTNLLGQWWRSCDIEEWAASFCLPKHRASGNRCLEVLSSSKDRTQKQTHNTSQN